MKNISSAILRKDAVEAIGKMTYKDTESDVEISALADIVEFSQNIRTARILANGGEKVLLSPDYKLLIDCKNPEYEINGNIADAKRVENPKGISSGFASAKAQGAKCVIIDFSLCKYYNHNDTARALVNRIGDFINDIVTECYIIYKDKYLKITKTDYNIIKGLQRIPQIAYFENKLKKAFD